MLWLARKLPFFETLVTPTSLDLVCKARFSATAVSLRTFRELVQAVSRNKPDIAYLHNTCPMVSPSAYRNHVLPTDIYRMVLDGAIRSKDVADPPTVL